ncbi:hypothetical protein L6R53_32400, partial [Myxococcota bacterium]|nr:hypothetical protein [Myxococcota bacterium]
GQAARSGAPHERGPGSSAAARGPDHQRPGSPHVRPPHRSRDHRYARPNWRHVHHPPHVRWGPPRHHWYRPLYAHWWVHPYYRWTHATVAVVWLGFSVHAWVDTWAPPPRAGWVWIPGYWAGAIWVPGYWSPAAPVVYTGYTYVPGWWVGDVYVEGYYRVAARDQGSWTWVDGYYLDDGTYVWGHWVPAGTAPEGYVWVPGYWDGEQWLEGFWRPERRRDYVWVGAWYDDQGIFHSGYWEPKEALAGHVWIPGWFDGEQWVEGYWVAEAEYDSADPENWQPPEGWDAGWDEAEAAQPEPAEDGELPLALPVVVDEQADAGELHAAPPTGG